VGCLSWDRGVFPSSIAAFAHNALKALYLSPNSEDSITFLTSLGSIIFVSTVLPTKDKYKIRVFLSICIFRWNSRIYWSRFLCSLPTGPGCWGLRRHHRRRFVAPPTHNLCLLRLEVMNLSKRIWSWVVVSSFY
jgi:hypothetical protein